MHISISEVRCYLQCPQQHYFRYVQRVRKPSPVSITMGRVYDTITQLFYQRLLAGQELPDEELVRVAIENEVKRLQPETDWQEETPGKAIEQITAAAKLYREAVQEIKPKVYQDRFEVAFENRSWTFLGFMDLVTENGEVIDNKLLTRTPNQTDVDADLQLTAYAFGYWHKYGELPKALRLDCVILNKTPKFVRLETQRTEADITKFLRQLGVWGDMIIGGIVYPNPAGWWCSPKSCAYFEECQALWA
ncbi:MAG: PD-(D/E)XK nuclease family protein [Moorellales bacterium]